MEQHVIKYQMGSNVTATTVCELHLLFGLLMVLGRTTVLVPRVPIFRIVVALDFKSDLCAGNSKKA